MARWRLAVILAAFAVLLAPVAVIAQDDSPGNSEPGRDQKSEKPPPSPEVDPEDVDESLEVLGTVEAGVVVINLPNGKRVVLDEDRDDRDQSEDIPFGATVDTTKGQLRLGKSKKATKFYEGKFKLVRGKKRKGVKKRVPEIKLVGTLSCPKKGRAVAAAGKRKRRLWGSGQGTFKTSGKHAAATVRGTKWLTEDNCDGTLIKVETGTVSVYDKVRKTRRLVRAGEQVLIPPPRKKR